MADAVVTIGADLSALRRDLAKFPNLSDAAAQKTLIALEKAVLRAEKTSKKAAKGAAKAQKKAAKDSEKAWKQFSDRFTLTLDITSIVAAGAAVLSFGQDVADMRNDLADLSMRSGLTTDQIQGLRLAFEGSGQSVTDMSRIIVKLPGLMSQAADGAKKQSEAFAALDTEVTDLNGDLRDSDEVFTDLLKGLSAIESPTERAAAATNLFENAGTKLLQALGDPKSLDSFIALAKDAAAVSVDGAESAADWQRAVANLGNVIDGTTGQLFDSLNVTKWVEAFTNLLIFTSSFIEETLKTWSSNFTGFSESLDNLFTRGEFTFDPFGGRDFTQDIETALAAADANIALTNKVKLLTSGEDTLTGALDDATDALGRNADAAAGATTAQAGLVAEIDKLEPPVSEMEQILDLMLRLDMAQQAGSISAEDFARGMALTNTALDASFLEQGTEQAEAFAAAVEMMTAELNELNAGAASAVEELEKVGEQMDDLAESFAQDLQANAIDKISGVEGGLEGIASLIGGPVAGAVTGLILNFGDTVAGLEDQLSALPDTLTAIPEQLAGLLDMIVTDFIPDLAAALPEIIIGLAKAIPDIVKSGIMLIPTIVTELRKELFGMIGDAWQSFVSGDMARSIMDAVASWWSGLGEGIKDWVDQLWEKIKSIFDFGALFDGDSDTHTKTGDVFREVFTLGLADTQNFGDTPGPVQAGLSGMRAQFSAGDMVVAARDEQGLRSQLGMDQPAQQMSPTLDLSEAHVWLDRGLKRNARGGGTLSTISGATPGRRNPTGRR